MNHVAARLPELSVSDTEPGLAEHGLFKILVVWTCTCGKKVEASSIHPTAWANDPDTLGKAISDLGAKSRELWASHVTRGRLNG